jgi:signal transduction histidine kinase
MLLVVGLFLLLAVLAVLQHKWLGEVSAAERERMQSNLKVAATHFSEELDREITRTYVAFQLEPSVPPDKTQDYYKQRYDSWLQTAPYPNLVKGLVLEVQDAQQQESLLKLNPIRNRFEAIDWPPELTEARKNLGNSRPMALASPQRLIRISLNAIDEKTPALLIPLLTLDSTDRPLKIVGDTKQSEAIGLALSLVTRNQLPNLPTPFGYAIVILDLEYIKSELIPSLANKHFAGGSGLDYNLLLRSRSEPTTVIYRSDPSLQHEITSAPDATSEVFRLRLDDLHTQLLGDMAGDRSGRGPNHQRANRVAVRVFNYQSGEVPAGAQTNDTGGRWELLLTHKAGSLEAAVAGSRRRNALISSGILLLLALSLSLIIVLTRRAERLARQQMEFVAGVSHELRTPLSVICSAGENLADGVIDSPEQIRRYGSVIRKEGRRLTEMVEQVLEFAGIGSGRQIYSLMPVDLNAVIDGVLTSIEPAAVSEGFTIEKRVADNLPMVSGDRSALGRAIHNLLDNAMKYSGSSRRVEVSAHEWRQNGSYEVQVKVADSGMGIPAADLPHIFEPFRRGNHAATGHIHGNGLGLSLVKHIVEAHGGKVAVASTEGRGSVFTIHLPVQGNGTVM